MTIVLHLKISEKFFGCKALELCLLFLVLFFASLKALGIKGYVRSFLSKYTVRDYRLSNRVVNHFFKHRSLTLLECSELVSESLK